MNGDWTFNQLAATLEIQTNGHDVTLAGNFVNNGATFNEATDLITFDGGADQTITNTSGETFFDVTVNKGGGNLILDQSNSTDVTVTNSMTFTQGIVITTSTELLTFSDDATSNGGDADSYVDGPIRKIGNDVFNFPTGDGAVWARLGISAPTMATTEYMAEYFFASHPDPYGGRNVNDCQPHRILDLGSGGQQ